MGKVRWVVALGVALVLLQGCTLGKYGVGDYFKHRGQDACDILEFGFTYTESPQFGLYACGVSVGPLMYCDIDGYFCGLGGGQLGIVRHTAFCYGVCIWGHEEIGWGYEGSSEDPVMVNKQGVGILGILAGPDGVLESPSCGPDYMPACMHYIHLGYVGFVGNIRYLQAIDFILGFAFIDIAGDDGYQIGTWFRGDREELQRLQPEPPEPVKPGAKAPGPVDKGSEPVVKPRKTPAAPKSAD